MSAENVELIRKGYESHGMGFSLSKWDLPSFIAMLADDVEWIEPNVPGLPWRGNHKGARDVETDVLGPGPDMFDDLELVPDSFTDLGDFVLAVGRGHLKAKATGRSWEGPFAHVWTVSDGKIVRWEGFADARQVAKVFDT